MDSIQPQLDALASNISDLESALKPLLTDPLTSTTSKLPLLDKAKLYILSTYAIESILFSFVQLNGVDAKSHPVFQELNRVKQYFQKIKSAEDIGSGGGTSSAARLDKGAAGRFIKAGLAGNDKYDREREERRDRERAGAKRKLEALNGVGKHTRFSGSAKRMKASEGETVNVVKATELDSDDEEKQVAQSAQDGDAPLESLDQAEEQVRKHERRKKGKQPLGGKGWAKAASQMQVEDPDSVISGSKKPSVPEETKRDKSKKKKHKRTDA